MEAFRTRLGLAAALGVIMVAATGASCASGQRRAEPLGAETVPFFEICGASVRAFIVGSPSAPRRLVFIHGWAGSGAEFLALAERLAAMRPDIVCFCLDLPGSGSSDKPPDAAYDVPYFRAVVGEAVRAASRYGLPPGEPTADVTLAGHSLGGHFCADYAALDGAGVVRLALISPAGWPGEAGVLLTWASKNDLALTIGPAFLNEATYIGGNRLRSVYNDAGFSEPAARYAAKALSTPEGRRALGAVTRNSLETDYIDGLLGGLAIPVMLAWGREDAVLPFSYAEKFLSRLPAGTRFTVFERCGHLPQTEKIPELAAALSEFMVP